MILARCVYRCMQAALRSLVGGIHTEEAAAALIKRLDSDRDGAITVSQLERFLDGYAARLAKAEAAAAENGGAEAGTKPGAATGK
jgi:Ca2+-binding EF-hand superfamily protein